MARARAECAIAGSREDIRHVSSAALFLDLLAAGGLTHEAIPAVHGDGGDCRTGIDRVGSGQGSGRYQGSARHDFGAEERRSDDAQPEGRHVNRLGPVGRIGQVDRRGSVFDEETVDDDGLDLTRRRQVRQECVQFDYVVDDGQQ